MAASGMALCISTDVIPSESSKQNSGDIFVDAYKFPNGVSVPAGLLALTEIDPPSGDKLDADGPGKLYPKLLAQSTLNRNGKGPVIKSPLAAVTGAIVPRSWHTHDGSS